MKIIELTGVAFALGLGLLGGCASSGGAEDESTTPAGPHAHHCDPATMGEMCPMRVEGTRVAYEEVPDGAALVFSSSTGDAAELRRRVHHMAEMHNQHHSGEPAGDGMTMPAATASAEDVEGGARLVLRPTGTTTLDALRTHVRTHAEQMERGECPMHGHGGGR